MQGERATGTNTEWSNDLLSDWQINNGPFLDARQQLKDNLRFLLRAANQSNPFEFKAYGIFSWPTNYVYASCYQSAVNTYFSFDESRPLIDNYVFRNFVYDASNLDDYGIPAGTYFGTAYDGPHTLYLNNDPTIFFNLNTFLGASPTVVPSSVLSASQAQWIWPPGSGNPTTSGQHNVYGLPYLSVNSVQHIGSQYYSTVYSPVRALTNGAAGYYETAQPVFQLSSYYFANVVSDPMPETPGFKLTNTTPLMVWGVGHVGSWGLDTFQVAGYAKLSVSNGNSGVYGYLGQYFDKAYKIGTNGVTTTNTTGVLSPYGEFFATEPGQAALMTMPDIDTGARGTCAVSCVSLQLDANHDGVMDLSFNGADATSQARPMEFWINDDNDGTGVGQETTLSHFQFPDNTYGQIRSQRGLEDFARLWVCGMPSLPASQGYSVSLNFYQVFPVKGSPSINLYEAETNGGLGYLTDTNVAQSLVNRTALATLSPDSTYTFPDNYFDGTDKHFLFEGVLPGEGELILVISKNGNPVAVTHAFIDLHDVKEMYQRITATPMDTFTPPYNQAGAAYYTNNVFDESNLGITNDPAYPFHKPLDESPQCVVFVHGWNMEYAEYLGFSETMFKRLYWQGYKGRFCAFRWATLTGFNTYNTSEFRAWKFGLSFKQCVETLKTNLPGYTMSVAAHSMGNILVGSALHRGLTVDNYILMQAAVPAGCYDTSSGINSYQPFLNAEATNAFYHVTPDSVADGGYRGYLTNVTGNLVNFFNTNDFALATGSLGGFNGLTHVLFQWWITATNANWEVNQKTFKPDEFNIYNPYYAYFTNSIAGQKGQLLTSTATLLHYVTDPQEMMAFVARSRSQAVGAKEGVNGVIGSEINLTTLSAFRGTRAEHSAEFSWNIQRLNPFYLKLIQELGFTTTH